MKRTDRTPAALYLLVFLQGLQRFAYYGFRASLALYLAKRMELSSADVGAVLALLYAVLVVAPLCGGYIADRFLGRRKTLLVGALLMAFGAAAMLAELLTVAGIGLITAGSALFNPSMVVLVGDLYRRGDARRDAGFTFLYMATNVGALLGPVVLTAASAEGSVDAGLLVASFCMLLVAGVFAAGQRLLRDEAFPAGEEAAPPARLTRRDLAEVAVWVLGLSALVLGATSLWPRERPIGAPWWPVAALVAPLVVALAVDAARPRRDGAPPLGAAAWQRVGVLGVLALLSALFWMVSGVVYDRMVRYAFDATSFASRTWLFSLNPVVVVVLGIPFALWWRRLDASPRRVSGTVKMGAGLLVAAVSAAAIVAGGAGVGAIVVALTIGTVAELLFGPVALAMVTKLAPPRWMALAAAAWAVPPMLGGWLGNVLSPRSSMDPGEPGNALLIGVAAAAALAGVLLLVLSPALTRRMRGAEEPEPAHAAGADPYRSGGAAPESVPGSAAAAGASDPARQMVVGALWALGGTAVTVASYGAASEGGRYMVAYGAILYGVITFFRGLAGMGARKGD